MKKGDASFTFLDRIREIRWNIQDGRWQSALALALTLPDICGGIAYPETVKKYRDGRVMEDRYGKPARDVGSQYIQWFDQYAGPFFKKNETDERPYLCGERCWQLRCEYLHQNKGFVNEGADLEVHFHLGLNCGTTICQLDQETDGDGPNHIRLDIEELCIRLCRAAEAFYKEFHEQMDFELYNTPVIDFIQWSKAEPAGKTIAVVCRDPVMAKGISMALADTAGKVFSFTNPYDAARRFEKREPGLWVVADPFPEKKNPPWFGEKGTPVLLLGDASEAKPGPGRIAYFPFPLKIEELGQCAEAFLEGKVWAKGGTV